MPRRPRWAREPSFVGAAALMLGTWGVAVLAQAAPRVAPVGPAAARTTVPAARFDTSVIRESSALQKSHTQNDVFWTLSDSGNAPVLYALDHTGKLLGSFEVGGVVNQDWEDLALDDQGRLYIGDVGNNANRRRDLVVYAVDEPSLAKVGKAVPAALAVRERLPFRYSEQQQPPDGKVRDFDAEGLFWARGSLYLLTKERTGSGTVLYRFDRNASSSGGAEVQLARIGTFDFGTDAHPTRGTVTGADVSEGGKVLAVLGYTAIYLFDRPGKGDDYLGSPPILRIALDQGVTKQCEGIAWDGEDLLISNEQGELHRIAAPLRLRPARYPAATGVR